VNRLTLRALLAVAVFAMLVPASAKAADLYNNTNAGAVSNNPTGATAFGLTCNAHVTQIVTYHWNNGKGATPGTISLKSNQTGQVYGPFFAVGSSGQASAKNVNWTANVSLDLPGGKGPTGLATDSYIITDSNNATWSMNAQSSYRGFAIVVGACTAATISKLPPAPTAPPPPAPTPKPCYVNHLANGTPYGVGATGPCFGPPGTAINVFIFNTQSAPYTSLHFKLVVANGVPALVTAPITGTGTLLTASAPVKLCLAPNATWQVWIANATRELGQIGGFSMTNCASVGTTGGIPTPKPATPPPGLANVKPCFVNTGAVASVGPCFGPANSKLAVRIYNTKYGPYTLLQFQTVVVNGVPSFVTTPLIGSGSLLSANVPAQLCVAKSPNKWQVWLFNQTKSVGEIGQFTITGCP
jgi:hypothetical protein